MILIDGWEFPIKYFPDGTLNMTALDEDGATNNPLRELASLGSTEVAALRPEFTIQWNFEDLDEQVVLWNIVHHLRFRCNASCIDLILPYVPNARMDRTHEQFTEIHTLRYFAEFLNYLNFNAVYVLDPHSEVLVTLINNCIVLSIADLVASAIEDFKPDYLFLPDKGALTRYGSDVIVRTPFFGDKTRDWKTGKIDGIKIINPHNVSPAKIAGKKILIIDDICSKGGTFKHAAIALRHMGFGEIGLYVTHCEDTIGEGILLSENSPISKIYATDTIYHGGDNSKVTVIPLEFTLE